MGSHVCDHLFQVLDAILGEGCFDKLELSEEQTRLLERFSPEFRERHIEAPHTGSLVAVDTFFVGTLKGVGKIYLQTAIDCHSRYACARRWPSPGAAGARAWSTGHCAATPHAPRRRRLGCP